MNTQLAAILLARIENAALPWVDKTSGLVRVISYKHKVTGKTVTIPVAADVSNDINCDVSTLQDMLPDDRYRSVLFFEADSQPRRTDDRTAMSWTGRFRVVVWIDCAKVGGGVGCGDVAYENLLSILENRTPFNSGPFRRVRITSVGGAPTRGREVFSKYTLDEERTQYVHYPFACFALDVEVSFSTVKGCEDELEEDNVNCWIPPVGPPRAWPRDLTCEQLTDPDTGLTDEQLVDCLGCETCPFDIVINVDGVLAETITGVDPCVDNTVTVNISYS